MALHSAALRHNGKQEDARWTQQPIAKSTARLGFALRAGLLIEILEARVDRNAGLDQLLDCFKRAQPLAKKRNLIAHNPLMLDLFVNEDETQMFAEPWIKSARSGETMSFEDLQEFAGAVEDLSIERRWWLQNGDEIALAPDGASAAYYAAGEATPRYGYSCR